MVCVLRLKHWDKAQAFEGQGQNFHYMTMCKTGVNAKIDGVSAFIFNLRAP